MAFSLTRYPAVTHFEILLLKCCKGILENRVYVVLYRVYICGNLTSKSIKKRFEILLCTEDGTSEQKLRLRMKTTTHWLKPH